MGPITVLDPSIPLILGGGGLKPIPGRDDVSADIDYQYGESTSVHTCEYLAF